MGSVVESQSEVVTLVFGRGGVDGATHAQIAGPPAGASLGNRWRCQCRLE